MKNKLLLQQMAAEVMAANEFQRGYNSFSGVKLKVDPVELDPEIAKAVQPWLEKALGDLFAQLRARVLAEIPGAKEKSMRFVVEHTLSAMVTAWGVHNDMLTQYSKLFDNMPYIGAVQYNPIGDLLAKEVKNFNLNYPLKSMGIHLEPPKPLECSVCGKTECEHLQTIFNKVRVADSDEGGVIDALFEEEEDGG